MSFDLLPWQTQPEREGLEPARIEWQGGILEIPRLGYLEVDELAQVRAVDPQNALYRLTSAEAVKLHRAVPDRNPRQCFALLTALQGRELGAAVALSEEDEAIQVEQAAIIGAYLEAAKAVSARVTTRCVTVIAQRVRRDWNDERSGRLPPELFNAIHEVWVSEEAASRGPEDPRAELQALEEALGKLQAVATPTATDPTGAAPSGTAAASGPAPPSSAASGSAGSPAGTSSRPSRRGTGRSARGSTARS